MWEKKRNKINIMRQKDKYSEAERQKNKGRQKYFNFISA